MACLSICYELMRPLLNNRAEWRQYLELNTSTVRGNGTGHKIWTEDGLEDFGQDQDLGTGPGPGPLFTVHQPRFSGRRRTTQATYATCIV